MTHSARFDDALEGSALVFGRPEQTVVARHLTEVADVVAVVERATEAGAWAFGYLSYEAGAGLDESLPSGRVLGVPYAWFGLGGPPRRTGLLAGSGRARPYWMSRWRLDSTPDEHAATVRHVQHLITDGSVYQVNVTTRARAVVRGDLTALYGDLVRAQGAAHNALLDIDGMTIVSISPELFLDWTPRLVRCRPMKGTARRDPTRRDDPARQALLTSAKNCAENVMIVDLVRNDLSRIADTGSVRVTELGACEPYGQVHQLSSTVECRPRAGTSLRHLLSAVFPSGSITGAPKTAAMHAITKLEPTPRGVYCGAIGWIAPPSEPARARFNVAIRTLVIDTATGAAEYGTGGGITIDSDPASEYQELLDKLAVLTTADHEQPDLELIETFGHDPSGFRHLDRHLTRLAGSAAHFGIPYSETTVRDTLQHDVARDSTARVRLRLRSDGQITIDTDPMPAAATAPVQLALDTELLDADTIWQHHKTNRRRVYDDARHRHPHAHDVVMVNHRGEITETTIANIAVRIHGRWYTPPLRSGCLPGIGRAVAIDNATLHEAVLTPTDLRRADRIAVINSLRGWREAVLQEDRTTARGTSLRAQDHDGAV